MTNAEAQRQDLLNAIDDEPVTFTIDTVDYTGMIGVLTTLDEGVSGGFLENFDLSLVVSLQDRNGNDTFETEPVCGDFLTIDSENYMVKRVLRDPFGIALQLDLENAIK